MQKKPFTYYISTIALVAFIGLGALTAFNIAVDPYRMYGLIEKRGFNFYKPSLYTRIRLLKAFEVRRTQPDAIVVGSSRCHLGFRPSHKGWSQNQKTYNLAFDYSNPKEMYYYIRHAHAAHPLKQVLLGWDTYQFTSEQAGTAPDFDPGILLNEHPFLSRITTALAQLKLLTSFDTLQNSIKTIQGQKWGEEIWLAPSGQRLGEIFYRRPYENFVKVGPRSYFEEIDKLEIKFKLQNRIPSSGPEKKEKKIYHAPEEKKGDPLTFLDYFRKTVEFCRKNNIDLKIFITPSHVHQLEIQAAGGEWPSIEKSKRDLVDVLTADARQHPDRQPIPLFDFSGYSSITTESLPPEGSLDELQNYWDSSHFKEPVGDIVLDRMLGTRTAEQAVPEDFGVLLTENNIDAALEDIRRQQQLYHQQHPEDMALINAWIQEFKDKNNIKD